MTVGELRKILESIDDDVKIACESCSDGYYTFPTIAKLETLNAEDCTGFDDGILEELFENENSQIKIFKLS